MLTKTILPVLLMACAPVIAEPDRPSPVLPGPSDTDEPDVDDGRIDRDGDGFYADEDCDDDDPTVYPGAPERCDPVDRDCDGQAFGPDDCPCPTVRYREGIFLNGCAETASWGRARDICAVYGMRLVTIPDRATNDQVQALASDLRRGAAWIGLTDQRVEGSFEWVDGSALEWSNWAPFEPNNLGRGEDCVQLYPWNGQWNDADCALQAPFICEPDPTEP